MSKPKFQTHLSWTVDFEKILELFNEMIKYDKEITSKQRECDKKKGLFSLAIRHLVEEYVNKYKNTFLASQKRKELKLNERST